MSACKNAGIRYTCQYWYTTTLNPKFKVRITLQFLLSIKKQINLNLTASGSKKYFPLYEHLNYLRTENTFFSFIREICLDSFFLFSDFIIIMMQHFPHCETATELSLGSSAEPYRALFTSMFICKGYSWAGDSMDGILLTEPGIDGRKCVCVYECVAHGGSGVTGGDGGYTA